MVCVVQSRAARRALVHSTHGKPAKCPEFASAVTHTFELTGSDGTRFYRFSEKGQENIVRDYHTRLDAILSRRDARGTCDTLLKTRLMYVC